MTATLFDLLDERRIADTSLDAYDTIRATLTARECVVFLALCDAIAESAYYADFTGGELAAVMGTLVTSVRPRLTGLEEKGWIAKRPSRMSRAQYEGSCHPYVPVLPRQAVERRLQGLKKNHR